MSSRVLSFSLTIQRFVLAGWIGAAVLFVITSVAEQTAPEFSSATRDQLATVRFPLYYRFGFIVHILAAGFGFLTWRSCHPDNRIRFMVVLLLTMLSGLAICLDFRLIYHPLQELIIPPGQVRGQEFVRLHTWSRHANELHISLMIFAALVVSWPVKNVSTPSESPS